MSQNWGTSGAPAPVIGDDVPDILAGMLNGVEAARTCYYGSSDPSSGASWGADELGCVWWDSTNTLLAGDTLLPILKVWAITAAGPTYGWRTVGARRYVAVEPNANLIDLTDQTDVAFTDRDISPEASAQAIAALLQVTVTEDAPAAGTYVALRKNGTTTDDRERRVHPQVAGIPVVSQVLVECNAGVFEYSIEASGADTFDLRIDLLGYYERAG